MSFERCVGLEVIDEVLYQKYRDGMMPILARYGGAFRYDFKMAETLKSATPAPINRLFITTFKDKASHDAFFEDAEYKKVREKFFKPAVKNSTVLATYEINR
ncbi:MAG TPA: DUF1330 domain-containing protein [bacterium]|nr:DUF1330 domain-containing protein [bacterium]